MEEIWDEHRWEDFLREDDSRVDRFMTDLYAFMRLHPPPGDAEPDAVKVWKQDLQDFLEARGWDLRPGHLPLNLSDDSDSLPSASSFLPLPEEKLEESEEELFNDFQTVPVYQSAYELGTEVLDWAHALPGAVKDSVLVQFCASVTEIAANIVRGHGMGYEQDMIGGNIACVKRGLAAANTALDMLSEMKEAPYLPQKQYRKLYEQTFEVRNDIGLYIQDLRDRFHLGID